jgi:hypothetical protein
MAILVFHQEIENMSGERLRVVVGAAGLVIGGLLGMAGSFVPSADLRGIAWGIDGIAIVVGCALLAVHHLRQGNDQLAAGFLVFLAAETLIVSSSAMTLEASAPSFGAGAGLWSAALVLISASPAMPVFVRVTGAIASVLLPITAVRIFGGQVLHRYPSHCHLTPIRSWPSHCLGGRGRTSCRARPKARPSNECVVSRAAA